MIDLRDFNILLWPKWGRRMNKDYKNHCEDGKPAKSLRSWWISYVVRGKLQVSMKLHISWWPAKTISAVQNRSAQGLQKPLRILRKKFCTLFPRPPEPDHTHTHSAKFLNQACENTLAIGMPYMYIVHCTLYLYMAKSFCITRFV